MSSETENITDIHKTDIYTFDVCVSVRHIWNWREIPTWCNNLFIIINNSTYFGHLYAHLQEYSWRWAYRFPKNVELFIVINKLLHQVGISRQISPPWLACRTWAVDGVADILYFRVYATHSFVRQNVKVSRNWSPSQAYLSNLLSFKFLHTALKRV